VTPMEPLDGDLRPVHGRYRGIPAAAFAGADMPSAPAPAGLAVG
jgi:hypothetical protein